MALVQVVSNCHQSWVHSINAVTSSRLRSSHESSCSLFLRSFRFSFRNVPFRPMVMVKSLKNSIIDMNTHHHEESHQSTCGDIGAWSVSSADLHPKCTQQRTPRQTTRSYYTCTCAHDSPTRFVRRFRLCKST